MLNSRILGSDLCPHKIGYYVAEKLIAKEILPNMVGKIDMEACSTNRYFDYVCNKLTVDVKSSFGCIFSNLHGKCDFFLLIRFNNTYIVKKLKILNIWLMTPSEILYEINDIRKDNLSHKKKLNFIYKGLSLPICGKYIDRFSKYEQKSFIRVSNELINISMNNKK